MDYTFSKPKKFKFTASCKDLDAVLGRLLSVMGASASQTKNYFIVAKGNKIAVLSYNEDTFCVIECPNARAESEGALAFDMSALQGVIKNRAEMNFDFTGSQLDFRLCKGKYSGHVVTLPITDEQVAVVKSRFDSNVSKKAVKSAISPEVLVALKEAMTRTNINDLNTKTPMLSYILAGPKSMVVSSHDQIHFAHCEIKVKGPEKEFQTALPSSHFAIIERISAGEKANLMLTPEAVRVSGKSFMLILPAHQTKAENFKLIPDLLKSGAIKSKFKAGFSWEKLNTCLSNLFTLNATNSLLEMAFSKDGIKMTLTTEKGSASDSIKVKDHTGKDCKLSINPIYLNDIVPLMKGDDLSLEVCDKMLMFRTKLDKAMVTVATSLSS